MKGFDISNDELAKSHARYMVGGRSHVENERIFRFGKLNGEQCLREF
jgi:threonine dehydratase